MPFYNIRLKIERPATFTTSIVESWINEHVRGVKGRYQP
jgi:hypothetical protein